MADLLPCPFCGSTDVDPEGWATLPEYAKTPEERSGPACDECGASAQTTKIWNTRSGFSLDLKDEIGERAIATIETQNWTDTSLTEEEKNLIHMAVSFVLSALSPAQRTET